MFRAFAVTALTRYTAFLKCRRCVAVQGERHCLHSAGVARQTARRDGPRYARSANRSGHLPEDTNAYTGFRVVSFTPASK